MATRRTSLATRRCFSGPEQGSEAAASGLSAEHLVDDWADGILEVCFYSTTQPVKRGCLESNGTDRSLKLVVHVVIYAVMSP